MAAMLMVLVYNLADTFFIGQTHDALQVAAVSLTTPVFLMFMALSFPCRCFVYQHIQKIEPHFLVRSIKVCICHNSVLQAIFNKTPASGLSFCSLLFSDIKKPQPLDFSKDCGAYLLIWL